MAAEWKLMSSPSKCPQILWLIMNMHTHVTDLSTAMVAAGDVAMCHIQEKAKLHSKPLSLSLLHLIQLSVSSL